MPNQAQNYDFWDASMRALGGKCEWPPLQDNPECGFWRHGGRGFRQDAAIAIWVDDGNLIATSSRGSEDPLKVWSWCGQNPIDETTYWQVSDNNMPWPGQPASLGHNGGPPMEGGEDIIKEAWDLIKRQRDHKDADPNLAANLMRMLEEEKKKDTSVQGLTEKKKNLDEEIRGLRDGIKAAEETFKKPIEALKRTIIQPHLLFRKDTGEEKPQCGEGGRRFPKVGLTRTEKVEVTDFEKFIESVGLERVLKSTDIQDALHKLARELKMKKQLDKVEGITQTESWRVK